MNKIEKREYNKKYRLNNLEYFRIKAREYYQKNKNKQSLVDYIKKRNNSKKYSEYQKNYQQLDEQRKKMICRNKT